MTDLTRRTILAAAGAATLSSVAQAAETSAAGVSRIVAPADRRAIPFPLHPISQVVASTDMPSGASFFHSVIPAGAPGAPPHVHSEEDEVYFILQGTAHFLLGDRVESAGPGAAVILPRGDFHANWNEGDTAVESLVFVSQNSRFEGFFDDVAARIFEAGLSDPKAAAMVVGQTGAEYGVSIDMSRLPDRAKPFFGMG